MGKEGGEAKAERSPEGEQKKRAKKSKESKGQEEQGMGKKQQAPKAALGMEEEEEEEEEAKVHTCCGCRFPLLGALLQLALGASVTGLGFLMAGISASLLARDTPYWAGILVCVVALLGLVMLCISYQPDEKTCIQFVIKVAYFLLSALSLIVCVLAVAFASYRYSQITQFTCEAIPEICRCKLDTVDPLSRTFMFRNVLDCADITSTFSLYLLIQIVLNLLAAIVGFAVCFVMWKDRYQVFYVGIRFHSLIAPGGQQQKV